MTLQLCCVFEVVFLNVAFFFVFREGLIQIAQLTITRSSLSLFFSLALLSFWKTQNPWAREAFPLS